VLSQFIREIDGNHTMGAGALAENIVDRFGAQPAPQPCPAPAPKAAAFPPIEPKSLDKPYSVDVFVMVGNSLAKGYYANYLNQWVVSGTSGKITPSEWWLIPETGTGTPVPQTSQEIKP